MIVFIDTPRDYRQDSTVVDLHTFQFTIAHTLGFSVFILLSKRQISNSLTVISNQESSCHSLIPFLPLFCNCQFRRLHSFQYQAHILTDWHPETWLFTLWCSIKSFFITTLHGPHGKCRVLLSHIVLGLFTTPLHSNNRGMDNIENSLSVVEACIMDTCLQSHCLAMFFFSMALPAHSGPKLHNHFFHRQ
jgi:hypothetical protein